MAFETPIMSGTVALMSAHFLLTLTFSPVFSSRVWITWSKSFFSSLPPDFWSREIDATRRRRERERESRGRARRSVGGPSASERREDEIKERGTVRHAPPRETFTTWTRSYGDQCTELELTCLDLRLDLRDVRDFRVVDERLPRARAGRELPGRRHLEALDHRLSRRAGWSGARGVGGLGVR
eukprot:10108-Pelagococcus_subviridis.AAC.1